MKIMKYGTKVLVFGLVLAFASCGKGQYVDLTRDRFPDPLPIGTDIDPITKYNNVWTSEDSTPSLDGRHKRTLANFLGLNTSHMAKLPSQNSSGCTWGYRTGFCSQFNNDCFSHPDSNPLANYFPATSSICGQIFPAPRDIGSVSYEINFAANVNDVREIETETVYIDFKIDTSVANVKVVFESSNFTIEEGATCGNDPCDKISANFSDACGTLIFNTELINGELRNSKLYYRNSESSYNNSSCSPFSIGSVNTSSALPAGIDNDGSNGELFKARDGFTGLNTFFENN